MKRVLVFRHVPHEGLGSIGSFLNKFQVSIDYRDLFSKSSIPSHPSAYDFVISMGGPMNVDETDRYPFLAEERTLIAKAIQNEIPVLGICLGAQMIAKSLGARVYAGARKEIGWYPIRFTKEAKSDPVFRELSASKPVVFHWHGDTFDLPAGATLLASSGLFHHQAFRFGRNVYAFQFHIEVTPEMIAEWVVKGEGELSSLKPPLRQEIILDPVSKYETPLEQWAQKVYPKLFSPLFLPPLRGKVRMGGETDKFTPTSVLPHQGGGRKRT